MCSLAQELQNTFFFGKGGSSSHVATNSPVLVTDVGHSLPDMSRKARTVPVVTLSQSEPLLDCSTESHLPRKVMSPGGVRQERNV